MTGSELSDLAGGVGDLAVSVGGTKLAASVSVHRAISHGHVGRKPGTLPLGDGGSVVDEAYVVSW